MGLNVDSGLHDFLKEDDEISDLALKNDVKIRDIRKTHPRKELHFFSGKIEEVTSFKIAVLGSVTVGILSERETVNRAKEYMRQGFTCLKIKGGIDVESDIARIMKVRETVGGEIELRFDANQGYDFKKSQLFAEKTREAGLELIEQPTPKGMPDMLWRVRMSFMQTLMAISI